MRGILINPHDKTVEYIDWGGQYENIREVLQCQWITTVTAPPLARGGKAPHKSGEWVYDCIYLNDEGLLADKPGPFFQIAGYDQPLAGRGLVVGITNNGDDCSCLTSVDHLRNMVTWPEVEFAGFTSTTREHQNTVFGEDFTVFSQEAHFKPVTITPMEKGEDTHNKTEANVDTLNTENNNG